MADNELRNRVWEIMNRPDATRGDLVDMLVRVIGDEKAKSYGLGFQDGQRRRGAFFAHQ